MNWARQPAVSCQFSPLMSWMTAEPGQVMRVGTTRPTPLASMETKELGSRITEELEAVAPLDQGQPLGDQTFQLERADLGTVLLALVRPLGHLVGIEVALDSVDAAVENVHDRPQQGVQVGLEAGVGQGRHQRIEHVGERALELRGLGQRARIGLIVVGRWP